MKTDNSDEDPEIIVAKAVESSVEASRKNEVCSKSATFLSSKENDSILFKDTMNMQNNIHCTTHNIDKIKHQLMRIQVRRARLEEKKQFLVMQAEAARLKEIQRLKTAVNLSIQQAETRILVAAARAFGRNEDPSLNQSAIQNRPQLWPSSWHHKTTQLQSSLKHRQLTNNQINMSQSNVDSNKNIERAFAA